ncbi:GumC family protein [Singulisphaera sp. PoT]|uniref:GumC family protein n=1 Tax=Singulisphaera sp. PoT TaxID=3411797 RepID=UPI003BF53900
MEGLQAYAGPPRPPSLPAHNYHHQQQHHHATTKPSKAPADYFRAIRRRVWLVLAIAAPLSILGGIWTARQPNVYSVKAQILIQPPTFDPHLSALIAKDSGGPSNGESDEKYVSNRIAMLRSKGLVEKVLTDPTLLQPDGTPIDSADEILGSLQSRPLTGTSQFNVSLDGTDPARVTLELSLILEQFKKDALIEIDKKIDTAKEYAQTSLNDLEGDLGKLEKDISTKLRESETIGPEGKNLKQLEYEKHLANMERLYSQLEDLKQQAHLAQNSPDPKTQREIARKEAKIEALEIEYEKAETHLKDLRRRIKVASTDPAVIKVRSRLKELSTKLTKLKAPTAAGEMPLDPFESLVSAKTAEIQSIEQQAQACLVGMRESMPEHQAFTDLIRRQETKIQQIAAMQTRIWEFNMVTKSRKDPVSIISPPVEPTSPIRPKRALNVALVIFFSLGLGIGLVCFREYLDHTVKSPEHLTSGLGLPLFGVVPRIRRSSLSQRGGHLWTSAIPDSIEADAYRNLRASLLGGSDRQGQLVSLLVTSAKAGEGKSTTALNLAATCARAGERTLLLDVDLRRPSLGNVFQDDQENPLGLVDVLRGDLPWQRTVVRTDIPNLDFIPTGDTRGVPIEILGTLELRQLILGLTHHYDRVILDGPAILGLADCRMLGRVVDGALFVVRSGAHELRPLQHAKTMLEQSQVNIVGVVFNGLKEDLKHWSSYGPDTPYGYTEARLSGRNSALGSSSDNYAALPLVGAKES